MAHNRPTIWVFISVLVIFCCLGISSMCGASGTSMPLTREKPPVTALFSHALLLQDRMSVSDPSLGLDGMQLGDDSGLKSPGKAVFLSLLLPGAGQSYVGATTKSRVFYSAEAVAWLAYAGFKTWESHRENEFQGWAAQHAGVDPDGKPDNFWQMMTYYNSRRDYEIYGRAGEPNRSSYPDLIGWDWQWDSESSRTQFRILRNSAKEANRKAKFSIGAMVLNRIVAAIDAYRGAKSYNRRRVMGLAGTKVRIKGHPFGKNQNVMLVIQKMF
jgi:hypothetical protein